MASPTNTQIETMITEAIELVDDVSQSTFQTNLANLGIAVGAAGAEYQTEILQGGEASRNQMNNFLASIEGALSWIFLEYGRLIGSPQTDIGELLDPVTGDLWKYFIDNTRHVKTRGITHGAVAAGGSNVGSGSVYRLAKQNDDQAIENCAMTVKTLKCVQDMNSGTRIGEELFEISHGTTGKDEVDFISHGEVGLIETIGPENGFGANMSFQDLDGTADAASSLTTIPDWSVTTLLTNFEYDTATPSPFESSPTELDGTAYSLKIKATDGISQKIRDIGQTLNPNIPHFFMIHYNRQDGTGTGTLTINMGAATNNVTLAAQTGWNVLALAVDQNLWYSLFNEDDLDLSVAWTKTGGTYINIDYMVFGEMVQFDGLWYMPVGGATRFLLDDQFTFTDVLAGSEGKVQSWLWRRYRSMLPWNATPSVSDP